MRPSRPRAEILLRNESILLRPYRIDDISRVYAAVRESIVELSEWLSAFHAGITRDEVASWVAAQPAQWEAGKAYRFAIVDADDRAFLGGCDLTSLNRTHRFANLAYWVRSSRTGEGIATTATLILARFGFEELGLNRIEIVAAVDNHASIRVAEKVGAQREGVLRNRVSVRGTIHDGVVFSLIPDDLGV